MRLVRCGLRSSLTQLSLRALAARALAPVAIALACSLPALAQTAPAPHPSATIASPKIPLHAEVFVDTNKLGQVSRVVSVRPSSDKGFNTQVWGNASQAFIRTPGGEAIPGLYRLSYDFNPATQKVRRNVELIKAGGVDPNAPGIVTMLQKTLEQSRVRNQAAAQSGASKLPDFDKISPPTPAH